MSSSEGTPVDSETIEILAGERLRTDEDYTSSEDEFNALELDIGFGLPQQLRWVLVNFPGLKFRSRVFDYLDGGFKVELMQPGLLSARGAQFAYHALTEIWAEPPLSEALAAWIPKLVPFAGVEGGHKVLCLDFDFDPARPPVILVNDDPFGFRSSDVDFVCNDFESLLKLPLFDENDGSQLELPVEPDPRALAWTSGRDAKRRAS